MVVQTIPRRPVLLQEQHWQTQREWPSRCAKITVQARTSHWPVSNSKFSKFHSSNPTLTLLSASQCYCALSLASNSDIGYSGCTSACAGNKSEICGGSSRLSVFNNTAYVPPSIPQVVGDYTYKGCYTELPNGRAMGTMGLTDTKGMTVEKCVGVCAAKGQPLAALEYGSQCFCGSSISSLSTTVDDSQCQSLLCPGSKLEYCSAGSRLQMYSTQG